jgi:hypothetical protein
MSLALHARARASAASPASTSTSRGAVDAPRPLRLRTHARINATLSNAAATLSRQSLRQAPLPLQRCSACGGLVSSRRRASTTAAANAANANAGAGVDAGYLACAQALRALGFQNAADIARVLDTSMNPNSLFAGRGGGSQRKGANAASAREDLSASDIEAVASFLSARLGCSAAEVVTVVSAHPSVLCYSVPDRLEPWARYLQEEVGVQDLKGAVLGRPSLLGLDTDASLRKIVGYLQSVGTSPEDIAVYVTKSI